MSASPSDMPSQLEAPHPEFGYLAPTMRFRRRIVLALKATVFGGLAGAAAMYFLTIDREDRPLTMLATPVLIAPASSTPTAQAPVAPAPAAAPAVPTPASGRCQAGTACADTRKAAPGGGDGHCGPTGAVRAGNDRVARCGAQRV